MFLLLTACAPSTDLNPTPLELDPPTWTRDAGPVLQASCVGCHQPGGIGTGSLQTYEEAWAARSAIASAVASGRMPPWMPADDCQDYVGDTSLSDADAETLLAWVDAGALEGDPADAPEPPPAPEPFDADLVLELPEAYVPVQGDDYRCQLLEHAFVEPAYVTGLQVVPGQQDLVHHVIAFVIDAGAVPTYEGYDADESGPGWTCFGGPTPSDAAVSTDLLASLEDLPRTLGSWVPGAVGGDLPEGTGMAVAPGDRVVLQMHYNTVTADPEADQSALELRIAETVDWPAVGAGVVDLGWVTGLDSLGGPMTIPAGEQDVTHSTEVEVSGLFFDRARDALGLGDGDPLLVHRVTHHMHTLGRSGRIEVIRPSGDDACLLDIPRWDFSWQGSYTLQQPVLLQDGDIVRLTCTWDNDTDADVAWGEGTADEMCLGGLYVTAAE